MATHFDIDDTSPIQRAREGLYSQKAPEHDRVPLPEARESTLPHEWEERATPQASRGRRHVKLAGIFLGGAVLFFVAALSAAGYFFYFGSNVVSSDKITIDLQGPTTIAGGDTVPLSLTITNKNPVAIENATIEIDFPDGTRSATNVLKPYPRYVENLGTLQSGATITRSVKAIVFGGATGTLTLPVSFSYGTANSNAVFQKDSSYALAISSTPLSVSVDALAETVSDAPLTFTLTVRSNTAIAMNNIVLDVTLPFGFTPTSSSLPFTNGAFVIGTLAPGATEQVTLTGTLSGQDNDQRVFHFTVGTASSSKDPTLAVSYMTQDASVTIAEPFITTSLTLNSTPLDRAVLAPGSSQNVALSYKNTLAVPVTDARIVVALSGSALQYDSIRAINGFYNSVDHTIVFSKDTNPALATLVPGASGQGSFSFSTAPAGTTPSPTISFAISASGTRVGQSNVPEQVTTSAIDTVKVNATVALSARASRVATPFAESGPVPPQPNQPTTYTILWNAQNPGSMIAGGVVTATLPNYVTYTNQTSGQGTFSYDRITRTVTWHPGDLVQGGSAEGAFQVSLTPSTSQKGALVLLTSGSAFSGYDRFAGVQITASAEPASTETKGDPGYVPGNGTVQ